MALSTGDLFHIICALAALLCASHSFGYFFQKSKQPQVIGEILGGLVLGPTFLKIAAPEVYHFLFLANSPTQIVLGTIYQMGLLLLMFCSGMEMSSRFRKNEKKTIGYISATGSMIPFAFSFLLLSQLNVSDHIGSANHNLAFTLVFAASIAVTSIPVISRILFDLGILDTRFSRIVLSAAVIEDIALYVILAIALALAGKPDKEAFGLLAWIGIKPVSGLGFLYHLLVTPFVIGTSIFSGPMLFQRLDKARFNFPKKRNPVAFLLLTLLVITGCVIFLDITPMLGAFAAGIIVKSVQTNDLQPKVSSAIKEFSFAFFIPIYFAIVGLKLDLIHAFNPLFFVLFLTCACAVKILSVYLGCRLAGEPHKASLHFGVAMNARGGPGIVLASLAFDAHIINETFYVTLVLLAIVTSLLAGSWLGFWREHPPLCEESKEPKKT
jgi:Kef-type K+ transport system membrane component KefB